MNEIVIILLAVLTLLLRGGLAIYACGLSRSKNAASTLARATWDIAVIALAYWAVGTAILETGTPGWFGFDVHRLLDWDGMSGIRSFGFLALVMLSGGIVVGSTIERSRLWPGFLLALGMGAFIVPLAAQWTWSGWLAQRGFIDGGGGVIHLVGGLVALISAVLLGARSGKYNRDGSANFIPGHSTPLALAGVLIILVAWVPSVALISMLHGTIPSSLPLHVVISACAAALTALVVCQLRYGKPDVMLISGALLGGCVAITPGAVVLSTPAAFMIGVVAGILVPLALVWIDLRFRIDDPTGATAIHAVAAAWGFIGTALLMPGTLADRLHQLGIQAMGVGAIAVVAVVPALVLLLVLRATIGLRVREADEYDGLDLAEHDLNAYPDFQQTMIKSYHLREA